MRGWGWVGGAGAAGRCEEQPGEGADVMTAGRTGGAAGAREQAGSINRKKMKQQQILTDVTL